MNKTSQTESTADESTARCWLCGGDARVDPTYAQVPLHRCDACGFLFDPLRSAEELKELYGDQYFDDYPSTGEYIAEPEARRYEAQRRLDWISGHLKGGNLLEVGAAAGFFLDEARLRGFAVTGIEPAPAVSQYAREHFQLDVRTGFAQDVQLDVASYDAICAWHVIEHIHDPREVLRSLRRAIRDDGMLFLEIPNIESSAARRTGANWFHLDPPNHVGFYTREQLTRLLAEVGFEVIESSTVSELYYYRPSAKLRPEVLFLKYPRAILDTKSLQGSPHPWKHALLRVVARAG